VTAFVCLIIILTYLLTYSPKVDERRMIGQQKFGRVFYDTRPIQSGEKLAINSAVELGSNFAGQFYHSSAIGLRTFT